MPSYFRLSLLISLLLPAGLLARPAPDTVRIGPQQLQMQYLQPGHLNYLVYYRPTPDAPALNLFLVDITVEKQPYQQQPAFVVRQRWDYNGATIHTAYSVFAARDFATLRHDTYWQRTGYGASFDFNGRTISYPAGQAPPDSVRRVYQRDFEESFKQYALDWHADLLVFALLPYRENRTFRLNFYDPGFGPPQETLYSVVGSENLPGAGGAPVPCWILEYKSKEPGTGAVATQRFWIAKKTREVLREEDRTPQGYRYKLKTAATQ